MKKKLFPLRTAVTLAMLTALAVVLDRFVPVVFTDSIKVTLTFVPAVIAAILYGPAGGATVWGLADLIGAILFPRGAYFPGFTVTAALKGACFGWFLYRLDPIKGFFYWLDPKYLLHVLPSSFIVNFVIGLAVDTLWISIISGSKTYWGFFVSRIPAFAALFIMNLVLIPVLQRLCGILRKHVRL
ncbi:MAG: folate family ECF transporter S component [Clostridia bacterium]|nr:folate family ECF transporter S component [Clostridia bacterium]